MFGIIGLDDVTISISRGTGMEAIKREPQQDDLSLLPSKKVRVKDQDAEVSQGVLIRTGDKES